MPHETKDPDEALSPHSPQIELKVQRGPSEASVFDPGTGKEFPVHLLTRSKPIFRPVVLLEQLVYQLLAPWSAILLLLAHSADAPGRQDMYSVDPRRAPATLVDILSWLSIVFFALWHTHMKEHGLLESEFTLMLINLFVWRLFAAFKYSTLTKREYKLFMQSPASIGRKWRSEFELITGWTLLKDAHLRHQLMHSAWYQGVDLQCLNFRVFDYYRNAPVWNHFLGGNFVQPIDHDFDPVAVGSGNPEHAKLKRRTASMLSGDTAGADEQSPQGSINAMDLCAGLLRRGQMQFGGFKGYTKLTLVAAAFAGSIPGLIRVFVLKLPFFGTDLVTKIMCASLMYLNGFLSVPLTIFLFTALHSGVRALYVARMLNKLIRLDRMSEPESKYPVICIWHPESVRTWLQCWLIVLTFGRRFVQRINTAVMVAFAIILVMFGRFVWQSYSVNDKSVLARDAQMYLGAFYLVYWGAILMGTLFFMSKANKHFARSEMLWHQHRLMLRCSMRFVVGDDKSKLHQGQLQPPGGDDTREEDEADVDERASMQSMTVVPSKSRTKDGVNEELNDVFATCSDTIETSMRLEPLRFLGSAASGTLMWSMLSLWASMVYFLVTRAMEMSMTT